MSIPDRGKRCTCLRRVQTSSATHEISYLMGTGGVFSSAKDRHGLKLTLLSSAEFKSEGISVSISPLSFL